MALCKSQKYHQMWFECDWDLGEPHTSLFQPVTLAPTATADTDGATQGNSAGAGAFTLGKNAYNSVFINNFQWLKLSRVASMVTDPPKVNSNPLQKSIHLPLQTLQY